MRSQTDSMATSRPPSASPLFQAATPAVAVRGVHLDFKGLPPTFERLLELIDVFATARYNAILVEWEDMFPWTVDQRFRSVTAYTSEQIRQFHERAEVVGLEVIPLIQCLGHLEFVLRWPEYEAKREVPDQCDVLNPLAEGAHELIRAMVDDVLALTPNVRRVHLGGDEAWTFGTHAATRAFIEANGKGALYLHHVEPLLQRLHDRGIRPLLWHDMMVEWDDLSLDRLKTQADLVVWGYDQTPDETTHHWRTAVIERFHSRGMTLWGGTAYKGADGCDADVPDPGARVHNAVGWMETAERFKMVGVFATAWSRYRYREVQNEPIDAALHCLLLLGVILHDGQSPPGGLQACIKALGRTRGAGSFHECHDSVQRFVTAQADLWREVAQAHKRLALHVHDPGRRSVELFSFTRNRFKVVSEALAEASHQVATVLVGYVPEVWIAEYTDTRQRGAQQALEAIEHLMHRYESSGPSTRSNQ